MPESASELKTREDVRRLSVGKTVIGSGAYGEVRLGRIWFKGKKPLRVAVKLPHVAIQTNEIPRYEAVVKALRESGVPVPHAGFVQHDGKWVQVMHLFGSTNKKSKIKDVANMLLHDNSGKSPLTNPKVCEELLDTVAKIANSGFWPTFDSIGLMQTTTGPKLIVHDLDAYTRPFYWRAKPKGRLAELFDGAWHIARHAGTSQREILQRLHDKLKNNETREAIRRMLDEMNRK